MNIARWALLALLSLPVVELYLLIRLGALLGFIPTLLFLFGAAGLGGWLLQTQGLSTWQRLQQSLRHGEYPAEELVNGSIIMLGGALLLLPGFLSDLLGLLCLLPPTRRAIRTWLVRHRRDFGPRDDQGPRTIEGEFRRED